jgi:hypothetical protein
MTKNKDKKTDKKTMRACDIAFTREKGVQTFYIKTTEDIENLFTNEDIETSEMYKNAKGQKLQFYKLSETLAKYADMYGTSSYKAVNITRYGTQLVLSNGTYNFSLLRTKGIGKGISIIVNDLIDDSSVQSYVEELARFIKFLHQNFINKTEVKATISLEI